MTWEDAGEVAYGPRRRSQRASTEQLSLMRAQGRRLVAEDAERLWESEQWDKVDAYWASKEKKHAQSR